MKELLQYIKSRKIKNSILSKKMGYSATYLSRVFNNHSPAGLPFIRLLIFALTNIAQEKITEGEKDIKTLKEITKKKKI